MNNYPLPYSPTRAAKAQTKAALWMWWGILRHHLLLIKRHPRVQFLTRVFLGFGALMAAFSAVYSTSIPTSPAMATILVARDTVWVYTEDGGMEPEVRDRSINPPPTTPDKGNYSAQVQDYINRFAPVARAEMKKYGIPASITLAQGIVESRAGTSTLAQQANNHFGKKCVLRTCKKGHCMNATDDTHKDFFRIYGSAWESYRDHSVLLSTSKRYAACFKTKDYRQWAHGLQKAGYATDKRYARTLIRVIEQNGLVKYDH